MARISPYDNIEIKGPLIEVQSAYRHRFIVLVEVKGESIKTFAGDKPEEPMAMAERFVRDLRDKQEQIKQMRP